MHHLDVGKRGEDIACEFLESKGHHIKERNFRMKFGEIDIVSTIGSRVYFTEVKTVISAPGKIYRPEDNVTPWKLQKLSRIVSVYLERKFPSERLVWEFLVVAITLDVERKTARVKVIRDVLKQEHQ